MRTITHRLKKSQYLYRLKLPNDFFDGCKEPIDVRIMLNDAILKHKGFINKPSALRFLKSEEDKHILMFQNLLDSEGFKTLDYGVVQVANYFLKLSMLKEMEHILTLMVASK